MSPSLTEILCGELNIDRSRICRGSHLVTVAGLDWVGMAVTMAAIEDQFGISLAERDLLHVNTIGDLDDVIHARTPSLRSRGFV